MYTRIVFFFFFFSETTKYLYFIESYPTESILKIENCTLQLDSTLNFWSFFCTVARSSYCELAITVFILDNAFTVDNVFLIANTLNVDCKLFNEIQMDFGFFMKGKNEGFMIRKNEKYSFFYGMSKPFHCNKLHIISDYRRCIYAELLKEFW